MPVPKNVTKRKAIAKKGMLSFKNLDRHIDRLSADSRPIYRTATFWLSTKCRPTIDWVSTNYWPIHRSIMDQLSAKCRRSVSEVSVKCRQSVGEVSVNEKLYRPRHFWNDYRLCLDRVSTDYRPLYRPSVNRLLTECRPLYRPISRSTLPTVNKIRRGLVCIHSLKVSFICAWRKLNFTRIDKHNDSLWKRAKKQIENSPIVVA